MEPLRNAEERSICPYEPSHYILKHRFETHLKKCRINYENTTGKGKPLKICCFNTTHRVPKPEIQYHEETCPDRKTVELSVFQQALQPERVNPLPSLPVPVDSSWDDEVVTESYNPQKYCLQNKIIRRVDTESAAVRKQFRREERVRLNNLDNAVGPSEEPNNNPVARPPGLTRNEPKKKDPMPAILPPTPAFSQQRNVEEMPDDVARIMEKVSLGPKPVIPKQKKK